MRLANIVFMAAFPFITLPGFARADIVLPFEGSASIDWGNGSNAVFKITNTGTAHALLGISDNATFGIGVAGRSDSAYGVVGQSWGSLGIGVWGSSLSSTGSTSGGFFDCFSDSGIGVRGLARSSSGLTYGGHFQTVSTGGIGVFSLASATTGSTHAGLFQNDSPDGTGIEAIVTGPGGVALSASNNGGGLAGDFLGRVAIHNSNPSAAALSAQNDAGSGIAVEGIATAGGYAGYFETAGGVAGVFGWNRGTGGGYSPGGLFYSDDYQGMGVRGESFGFGPTFGGYFSAGSTSGTGVAGQATALSGATYGGWFNNWSTSGTAVYGEAISTTGATVGVSGVCKSTSGYAVKGRNTVSNNTGYLGAGSYGVYATANSSAGMGVRGDTFTTNSGVGVYGRTTNNTSGYGVYSLGRFGASGTKSFQIDHPLDPENQYLNHYCAEGPETLNVYRGNVTLDDRGEAWVTLPDYFAEINRDPSYQLTPVGKAAPRLHVAAPIADSRFQIAGGTSGLKVSWRVEAVRNDRFVRTYGAPVEVEKPEHARGTYLQPELYGQPEERGQDYMAPAATEESDAVDCRRE